MKWRIALAALVIIGASLVARAQFQTGGSGVGSPGGSNAVVQFNTNGIFGGISGVTSDQANIGFTTSSKLILYGITSGNCLKVDANNQISDAGIPCGGTSATNIAAGSNITTSGSIANVTVNVVATPSFTTIIASGNVTAGSAQFTGAASGTTAQFQTITDTGFTAAQQCVQATNGILAGTGSPCSTATATSIAAGSNVTTSGTASNVTVNVVATPSFTTVIASGNLTAGSAQFAGFLTAGGASLSGLSLATGTMSGNLTGTTHNLSGNLTAGTAQFTGAVTGTTAVFQTITDALLGGCLNATAGVISSTGVSCATQTSTPSIAAGTNITTSGTTANVTVNMVPTTPEFGLQYNHAGVLTADSGFTYFSSIATHTLGNVTTTNARALSIIGTLSSGTVQFDAPWFMNITTNAFASGSKLADIQASGISYFSVFASSGVTVLGNITGTTAQITGWLTAPGVNMQTATLAGALNGSTAVFTGNLTAQTAQFSGFMTAGGASISGLTIATETISGNLTGTTAAFSGNLTGTTAQFSGQVTGTTAVFQTVTAQNFTTVAAGFVAAPAAGSGTAFLRGDNTFSTPTTTGLTTPQGWLTWNGLTRTAADSVGFITTGFANIMSINVVAGRTYKFIAELPLKSATAATGGIGLRIGGGATATAIVYDGWIVDSAFNGTKGNTQATALSTTVASTSITGTTSHATLVGTITVNAAGSLIVQASGFSTVTAASAVTIGRGATFTAEDIP